MIYYVNAADIGLDGEVETKAVGYYVIYTSLPDFGVSIDFDNPFGTSPPAPVGFITVPSRVSSYLPHTLSPPLINHPPRPSATHRDI